MLRSCVLQRRHFMVCLYHTSGALPSIHDLLQRIERIGSGLSGGVSAECWVLSSRFSVLGSQFSPRRLSCQAAAGTIGAWEPGLFLESEATDGYVCGLSRSYRRAS